MALRESVPREFTDDVVRWYRHFTQPMIIAIGLNLVAGLLLCSFLSLFHLQILGIMLMILSTIISLLAVSVPLPNGNIMGGSGILASKAITRRLVLRKRGYILYIKGYECDEKEKDVQHKGTR